MITIYFTDKLTSLGNMQWDSRVVVVVVVGVAAVVAVKDEIKTDIPVLPIFLFFAVAQILG